MAQTDFETLTLHFDRPVSGRTDREYFKIIIHHSGTVRVEIGRFTYYGFWQQIPNIVKIDVVVKDLHDTEDDAHFGSHAFDRGNEQEIVFTRSQKTQGLRGFVGSVIEQIDERFHDQCRRVLGRYD
ncbi:hypothetical protein RSSM_03044 [Rhodopirellula sallentina SM41]|uniref:Uncharacterized protein n=1 Tax=Rhodopirellula sallentina SM41 TaxID=1263870 RepID=M5U2K9_9BACT|nr:hypothetical protein RSSM_03044 [Rhodopirellula sallentina SM41]